MHSTSVASARQIFFGTQPKSIDERIRQETSFFQSVCLPNGTRKTTSPSRLGDVDDVVCEQLKNREMVHLLDVGISSGVTTIELLSCLAIRGIHASGIGVDICVRGFLCSWLGIDVLYDAAGNVLQLATPFFARGRPHRSQGSFQSNVLGRVLGFFESPLLKKWMMHPQRSRPIDLVSPRLLERRDFKIVEHDVMVPMPEWDRSFDLIRAANVLNLDYFSPPQIRAMIGNMTSWLKNGGYFAVCRTNTQDGRNHGSLYRKQEVPSILQHVHRFGQGSEIDSLIQDGVHVPSKATSEGYQEIVKLVGSSDSIASVL